MFYLEIQLAVVFCLILGYKSIIQGSTLPRYEYRMYRHFIVVSSQGNDTEACLNATSLEAAIHNPCKTLDHALNSTRNATEIILEPGEYNLAMNATFENVFDFGFSGNGSLSEVVIHCSSHVGLTFIRSGDINIRGITFTRCGSLHASTIGKAFRDRNKDHIPFYSGVFFAYTHNVKIEDCTITESPGIGLILYDVGGEVNISRSHFTKNTPEGTNCSLYACAGGGVYVEFTFEGAIPPFNQSNNERLGYQNNNNYLFEGCTFEENVAPEQNFLNNIEYPSGTDHMPFGRGGGLSFFVKGTATNNTLIIHNCNFLNNEAVWGAGLFLEFQDETQNNTMYILESKFYSNFKSTAGGAVRTGFAIWKREFYPNTIIHEDCVYENNSAWLGGGVSHYGPFHPVGTDYNYHTISFKRCNWSNNKATVGSALGVVKSEITTSVNNMKPNPKELLILPYIVQLENCSFIGNSIIKTEDKKAIGQGALYTFKVPLVFQGNTTFENNIKTALVLDNAVLTVYGRVTFTNNSGALQGGALGMYGVSLINLMPAAIMYFKRNSASYRGGAMFVDVGGPPIVAFKTTELNTRSCFFAYNDTVTVPNVTDWKANITFESNHAFDRGNSIYATTLQACRSTAQHRDESLDWHFIRYLGENGTLVNDTRKEISTDPIEIKVVNKEWKSSPGETFSASIKLISEKGSFVQGVVNLAIDAPESCDVKLGISPLLLIKDVEKDDKVSGLIIKGSCGELFDLTLSTTTGRTISKTITNLSLSECHTGFENVDKECKCISNSGISKCSPDRNNVYLKNGYWGGEVGRKFTTYPCPPGYCNNTNERGREFKLEKDTKCAENRNSDIPLCGECRESHEIILGSAKCVKANKCLDRWILPLVFFVVTPIFVLLVLKINIDIFTAYLNAWLYFYQIIEYLLKENVVFEPLMTFIIGLANLTIRIKEEKQSIIICIYPGLTNFYALGASYIFPFYVLLLLWFLSKIARFFPRWYIVRNVSHALCNLLVFCYTDIAIISFKILHYVYVGDKWMLYLDGHIDFVGSWKTHLPLTILAILLLIFFVAPLPIVLCFTPWFFKKFPFLAGYRLFFDLFQSCFEDQEQQRNHRWFSSFYFFCRIWVVVLALYVPPGPLRRSILEASCIAILGIFLWFKPYNTAYKWLNASDAVFLTTLCFITVFSSARTSDAGDTTLHRLQVTVNVLAYVPLMYLAILGVFYVKDYVDLRGRRERLYDEPPEEQEKLIADPESERTPSPTE